MSDGFPHPSVDELLDRFIAAWHAGEAPSVDAYQGLAAEADRDELLQLLGAFLQLAPTVEPATTRGLELIDDPLVHRLARLEDQWWDAQAPWGARLRVLREQAGLSLQQLGERFASHFELGGADAASAPDALGRLEAEAAQATGVTARAARALEELLGAARGSLAAGASPPLGAVLMRGDGEREQLADLLRHVDDALPASDDGLPSETLHGLLGVSL